MARFAANLTFLFTELPMTQRFQAARAAGFEGVEILFPYDFSAAELSVAALRQGLELVLLNTPPPNWAGGPRGFAAEPGREQRFRHDFDRALRFAQALRVRHIHIMAGKASGPRAEATYIDNLRWAAARAPHASLVIEPCNTADLPGYFLSGFEQAAGVIEAVGAPNLGLLFDAYHAHRIATEAEAGLGDDAAAHPALAAGSAPDAPGAAPTPSRPLPQPGVAANDQVAPMPTITIGPGTGGGSVATGQAARRGLDAVEALWARYHPLVRHIQIAGFPGRHEPRGGDIDFAGFFRSVDAVGYRGWVSAEYTPRTTTEAGLRWLRGSAKG